MRTTAVLLVVLGCVNSQHAEVRLPNNPAGADCFSRCVQTTTGAASVDCVATCPGAIRDASDCGAGTACVEDRQISTGKTALLVIAGVVAFTLIYSAGSSNNNGGAP